MNRWDIINDLITKYSYSKYLEIGVLGGECISAVKCETKHSVDPAGNATFNVTSDEFFRNNTEKYDIIFIDGLHQKDQVERDVENSLKCLLPNGTIVLHDCLPEEEYQQLDNPVGGRPWAGTVWKAWATLRTQREDLEMFVVDTDWGCGIIRRGSQKPYVPTENNYLNWQYYCQNRDVMMNIGNFK